MKSGLRMRFKDDCHVVYEVHEQNIIEYHIIE